MHILGHAFGVTANVEVSPALQPVPEGAGLLAQTMLHVNFFRLITREGQIQSVQDPFLLVIEQFFAVEEVSRAMLLAEDQPITAPGSLQGALFEEGAKRRQACARPAQDDVGSAIAWQAE